MSVHTGKGCWNMKKKLIVFACLLAFAIPVLCVSEMSDTGYTCDECKYAGRFRMVVTGTETRDGIYGEWVEVLCPECGEAYMPPYWRATENNGAAEPISGSQGEPASDSSENSEGLPKEPSPDPSGSEPQGSLLSSEPEAPVTPQGELPPDLPGAEPQGEDAISPGPEAPAIIPQVPSPDSNAPESQENVTPTEPETPVMLPQEFSPELPGQELPGNPAPAEPEAPVALPKAPSPEMPAGAAGEFPAELPVVLPAETSESSGQQTAETLPPVPEDNAGPVPAGASSGQIPEEMLREDSPNSTPSDRTSAEPFSRSCRNVGKYPYFSVAWPSRRLNTEGDPEALAPIPGVQIYPESPTEGSLILQHMLNGGE